MSGEKTPQLPPFLSDSLPRDQSLELLLGAIAKGLDGLTAGNIELRRAFSDLHKFVVKNSSAIEDQLTKTGRRTEGRIADLQAAVDEFVRRVEHVVEHQITAVGSTVEARKALEASAQSFDKAVKDQSRKFDTMVDDGEGAAPKKLQIASVWLTNFAWKNKRKLIGWTAVATASIYNAIEKIAPYWHEWFK